MKMTDSEKLILLMLCDLFEKTGIESEIDPSFIKAAIFGNHLWGITWEYSGIPFENRDTPDDVKEVVDYLDMWSFIEVSFARMSDQDKDEIREKADLAVKEPYFRGFDGNNEPEYMSIASFLINELDRFQEFKGRSMNSHMPSLETYRRMYGVFRQARNTLGTSGIIKKQDMIEILLEMIHPSNRK